MFKLITRLEIVCARGLQLSIRTLSSPERREELGGCTFAP